MVMAEAKPPRSWFKKFGSSRNKHAKALKSLRKCFLLLQPDDHPSLYKEYMHIQKSGNIEIGFYELNSDVQEAFQAAMEYMYTSEKKTAIKSKVIPMLQKIKEAKTKFLVNENQVLKQEPRYKAIISPNLLWVSNDQEEEECKGCFLDQMLIKLLPVAIWSNKEGFCPTCWKEGYHKQV
jgi:hypothetical protein